MAALCHLLVFYFKEFWLTGMRMSEKVGAGLSGGNS